ncbi:MAG: hypothetical protein AMXMBFR23_16550 [Chloroflexota bacterium]
MSLRARAVLLVTGCTVLVLGVIALVDRTVVGREFENAERQEVERDVQRVQNAIRVELDALDVLLIDWSSWDETYEYAAGINPAFEERSLPDELDVALQVSTFIIVDLEGRDLARYSRTLDGEPGPITALTPGDPQRERLLRMAARDGAATGILSTDGGALLLVARPILRNDDSGPSRGTTIMGRWLDESFAERLASDLTTPLEVMSPAGIGEGRLAALLDSEWDGIVGTEEGGLVGYGLIRDLNNDPVVVMRTLQERNFDALGRRAFTLSLTAVGVMGLLLAAVFLAGLELALLRPMLRLRRELAEVGAGHANAVTVTGTDEVDRIASSINDMLERLAVATSEQARLTVLASDQRNLAETALAEMSDGLLAFGSDGLCTVCNPAAGRMLGLHPTRVIGRHVVDLLPGLATVPATDGPQLLEMNGRTVAVTRNVASGPSRARASVVVLRDVTEILDVERLKRDIVATVSHELRTPLTAIRATVDLFESGDAGPMSDVQQRMVLLMGRNVDRLRHIVNDLLDLTSLESGRVSLDLGEVDMAQACERVVEDLRPAATAAQVDVTVESPAPGEAVIAWADASRIRQVIENLVQNAIKFSPAGSQVRIGLHREGAETVVRIVDRGIGIAPEEHARVFEKFYRTRAGSRAAQGTGLGLPIARLIVEMHGGRIHVESDGERGTTVVFTLPAEPPAPALA